MHPTPAGYAKIGAAISGFLANGNTPPVIDSVADQTDKDEGDEMTFTVTGSDGDGDDLTFSLSAGAPAGAAITSGGVFTWTPTEEQGPADYQIGVVVTDAGDDSLSDGLFVNVEVVEVNTPPTLENVPDQNATEEVELMFTVDQGADDDLPAQTLTYELDGSAPSGASITPEGVFTWTPDLTQGGTSYTFDIIVEDPDGERIPMKSRLL